MKKIKALTLLIVFFFVSCTSDNKKSKNVKNTPILTIQDNYNPKTVCDCSADGIRTLTKILKIREKFENIEKYKNDLESVQNVSTLSDNFLKIRNECLKKFATSVLNPSECNDPYKIRELREKLISLGIQTN